MLNVYQIQFIQQIVSLIGKYRFIRISLCFKCSITCRTKRVRQFNFPSFTRGLYELQHFWWKGQEYCMLFKNLVSVDPGFFCWCQKNKDVQKRVFSSIAKSRKVFLFKHSFSTDVKKSFKLYFCSCNFIQKNRYQSKLISALTQKQFLSVIIVAFIFVEIFYLDVSINVIISEKCFQANSFSAIS